MDDASPGGGRAAAAERGEILALIPALRAFARSLAGDVHAADDLVQDTVVLALQGWDGFTPGTNLKAWLFRILRNRHLTVRARKHHSAEIGVDDLSLFGSVPAVQEGRAELPAFKAAFAELKPVHREALVLYAVHGLSLEEIAEVMGCNVGTVKSRMNRARTALKKRLLGDGREDAPRAADRRDREASQRDRPDRDDARPSGRGGSSRVA